MVIDEETLRDAKLENLERLARALKVRLPAHKRDAKYGRALAREVARGLSRDARAAAALVEV